LVSWFGLFVEKTLLRNRFGFLVWSFRRKDFAKKPLWFLSSVVERMAVIDIKTEYREVVGSIPTETAPFYNMNLSYYKKCKLDKGYTMKLPNIVYEPKRHILAIAAGILAGYIPSVNSNIHPLLLGAIFAVLLVKLFFGDYDTGYQWTKLDIVFAILHSTEGILGAWIAQKSL